MSKIRILALALVVALVSSGLAAVIDTTAPKKARAQSLVYTLLTSSGQISIASGTPAVIVSATSGKSIVVTGLQLATVSTGGVVTFYNGTSAPTTTGLTFLNGNTLNAYVPASTSVNNNVVIPASLLPPEGTGSIATTAGNAFCAQLNGCTLVFLVQYYLR